MIVKCQVCGEGHYKRPRDLKRSKFVYCSRNCAGLWKNEKRVAGKTEAEIYEALGKSYKEPERRGM